MIRSSAVSSVFILAALASCGDSTPPPASPENTSAKPVESKAATATAPPYTGKPKLGSFGVDTAGMDKTVKPGKDFYQYAGGTWMKENKIPSDKSKWGMFDALREDSDVNVHKILDEISKAKNDKGSNAQKIGDYYATYLDVDAIEKKGFAPAKPGLDAIASAKKVDDIAKLTVSILDTLHDQPLLHDLLTLEIEGVLKELEQRSLADMLGEAGLLDAARTQILGAVEPGLTQLVKSDEFGGWLARVLDESSKP